MILANQIDEVWTFRELEICAFSHDHKTSAVSRLIGCNQKPIIYDQLLQKMANTRIDRI